jgi:prepilin peptidase CpaA
MNDIAVSLLDPLAALVTSPRTAALIVLLIAAGVIDYRTFRIPNWLTVGGACVALGLALFLPATTHPTFLWALGGLATGFVIMLPLYALKVMGAGDVKLMAMAGAFLGVPDTLYAVLYTFIAGGVAALLFAVYHKASKRMAANVRDMVQSLAFAAIAGLPPDPSMTRTASIGKLPYGVSIAIGTIAYVVIKQVGHA